MSKDKLRVKLVWLNFAFEARVGRGEESVMSLLGAGATLLLLLFGQSVSTSEL